MKNNISVTQAAQSGFTLIELAIVIAIVSVLAAVAVPKFQNAEAGAERGIIQDMTSQLKSAMSIYIVRSGKTPEKFSDFVKTTALTSGDAQTISLLSFGPGAKAGTTCNPGDETLTCDGGADKPFRKWKNITYNLNGGAIALDLSTAGKPVGTNSNTDDF